MNTKFIIDGLNKKQIKKQVYKPGSVSQKNGMLIIYLGPTLLLDSSCLPTKSG
jgi:hypothetical protein